jgi:hypothetical protein
MDGETFDPFNVGAVTRGLGEEGDGLAPIGGQVAGAGRPACRSLGQVLGLSLK